MSTFNTYFPKIKELDEQTISYIANLVNIVYAEAESDMWQKSGSRTNVDEIKNLIHEENLILAKQDEKIVGLIAVRKIEDSQTGEFGMLVVDPNFRKNHLGSLLVTSAEEWAKKHGYINMRLELLTPRHWKHPSKEFLKIWYSKIGYKPTTTEPFELLHPDKINALATECDFTVCMKTFE